MSLNAGDLTVSLSLGNVVINGLRVSRNQANATQAYFAAEAGAEKFLWMVRKGTLGIPFEPSDAGCPNTGWYILDDFTGCNSSAERTELFIDGPEFYISYEFAISTTTIRNFGEFRDTRRVVQLKY